MKIDARTFSIESAAEMVASGQDTGTMTIVVSDGEVTVPKRVGILNTICWHPLRVLELPILKADVTVMTNITAGTWADIFSKLYSRHIEETTQPHMHFITEIWHAMNYLYQFILEHLGPYQSSMSIIELAQLQESPSIKALTDVKMDSRMGTKECEKLYKSLTTKLIDIIGQEEVDGIPNILFNYMETGILNKFQIPQQMLAYGARSDIDDDMIMHVINESATSGLKSAADLAVESLSTKKSSYFNKTVIKDTQYFARLIRLISSRVSVMYPGHCGSTTLLPITVPEDYTSEFIDKIVYLDGERLAITDNNHAEFAGKRVGMVSPMHCRHKDGVCEHCAGRNTSKPWAFLPEVNLGNFAATKVGGSVSQKILSSKHLVATNTIDYVLPPEFSHLFTKSRNGLAFKESIDLSKTRILVPKNSVRFINDLDHGVVDHTKFSKVTRIIIEYGDDHIEGDISNKLFTPYFSKAMLKQLTKLDRDELMSNADYYEIPLKGFNRRQAVLNYDLVNDDMVKFARTIAAFLKTKIASYTSCTNALQDFIETLYQKTSVNIFFIEVILKAYIQQNEDGKDIDPDNVEFLKMSDNISKGNISAKLAHQEINAYFMDPKTYTVEKEPGFFDPFFGLNVKS